MEDKSLFRGVRFLIGDDVDILVGKQLTKQLKKYGARRQFVLDSLVTHYITLTPMAELEAYGDVCAVTPLWISESVRLRKRQPVNVFQPGLADLFKGFIFYLAVDDVDDQHKLWCLIRLNGGTVLKKLEKNCTHVVAATKALPQDIPADRVLVVQPHWIMDCVTTESLRDVKGYQLDIPSRTKSQSQTQQTEPSIQDNGNINSEHISDHDDDNNNHNNSNHNNAASAKDPSGYLINRQVAETMGPRAQLQFEAEANITSGSRKRLKRQNILTGEVFYIVSNPKLEIKLVVDTLEMLGASVRSQYDPSEITSVICMFEGGPVHAAAVRDKKRLVTAFWLTEVLEAKENIEATHILHRPLRTRHPISGFEGKCIALTGFLQMERTRVLTMIKATGAKYTSYFTRRHAVLICKYKGGDKYKKAVEWGVPVVSEVWLEDCIRTWKWQAPGKDPTHQVQSKKKSGDDASDPVRVCFTCVTGRRAKLEQVVASLGGIVVAPQYCTHLVADKVLRTPKMLTALCVCKYVVRSSWITGSELMNGFIEESQFALRKAGEEKYNFTLEESIMRCRGRLFEPFIIYITPSVTPDLQTLRTIVEAGGGQITTEVPSPMEMMLSQKPKNSGAEKNNKKIVIVTCSDDLFLCERYIDAGIPLYTAEVILMGALKQELEWTAHLQDLNPVD